MSGTYQVSSINGSTVTLSSVFQGSGTATGATLSAGGPSDTTADGGGITLKGANDKSITWTASNDSWVLSEHVNIPASKEYHINGTSVLSASTVLGKSFDTDGTLGGGSSTDGNIPTQLAVKTYVDSKTDSITATAYFVASMG